MRRIGWILLAILLATVSVWVGKVNLHPSQLLDSRSVDFQILWQIRVPRVLLAFLSGGILSLSGLLFQTLFRNPLTTPFTLGISSGATLGASAAILLGLGNVQRMGFSMVSLFGFLGALSTLFLIYTIAKFLDERGTSRLILVGIALSYLYGAVLLLFYYMSDFEESFAITRYTMGSLLTVGYGDLLWVSLSAALLVLGAYYYRHALKLLSVSYAFAFLRGVEVEQVNMRLFFLISLAVGILVSVTGPIGFVGLIVPHMVKVVLKKSVDAILWQTFFAGGLFLMACDTIARVLPTASSVPVGVLTSLIGGAIFIWILIKR